MSPTARPVYETITRTELPGYLTVAQAAGVLDCTPARVRQMIDANNFPTVYALGDRLRLLVEDEVRALLAPAPTE